MNERGEIFISRVICYYYNYRDFHVAIFLLFGAVRRPLSLCQAPESGMSVFGAPSSPNDKKVDAEKFHPRLSGPDQSFPSATFFLTGSSFFSLYNLRNLLRVQYISKDLYRKYIKIHF